MSYDPLKIKTNDSRDLNHLQPYIKFLAESLLKLCKENIKDYEIKVVATLRSFDEQNKLYEQGRTKPGNKVTNAKGGQSIHNWGCAFDIGVFKGGIYNPKGCEKIYKKAGKLGKSIGLEWGGDWEFVDLPHFQYTGIYSNSEFLKLVKNKSVDELIYKDEIYNLLKYKGEI